MARQQRLLTSGRLGWLLGSIAIFAVGALVGIALDNVWLGLLIAAIVSIGWLLAYESWRGRNVGVDDPDRGVEL